MKINNKNMFITITDRDDCKRIINLNNINDVEFKEIDRSYQISEIEEYYVQINLNNEKTIKISEDEYKDGLKTLLEGLDGQFTDWK